MSKDDSQLALLDVDHPAAKPLKAAIRKYNTLIDEKNTANSAAKEQRVKILDIVKGMDVKPNAEGAIEFKMGKTLIKIAQGETQLKIKEEEEIEETDAGSDDDEAAQGAEQVSRRGRTR